MNKVAILLDGKEIFVDRGSNLLEAALTHGFAVPHLCYDPRLKPFGSCRLCFVEVEGRPAAVPACGTQVSEGMRVTTNSERVTELRRIALELLLSEHCGDCVAPC
ncbi:MAG: (2Fe-2S)-binding protein, partial [Dethiobacter sp.]|nr:(2Fe-2S)-binding protein [Dethiobacter sp.]